jgi:hypothetical protein
MRRTIGVCKCDRPHMNIARRRFRRSIGRSQVESLRLSYETYGYQDLRSLPKITLDRSCSFISYDSILFSKEASLRETRTDSHRRDVSVSAMPHPPSQQTRNPNLSITSLLMKGFVRCRTQTM